MAQRPFRTYDEWRVWSDQVHQDFADRNARLKREAEERGEPLPEPIKPDGKVAAWLQNPPGGGEFQGG
jgi:hypothetical protein